MITCQVQLGVSHCSASMTLLKMEAIDLYKRRAVRWWTTPDHEGWPAFPGTLAPSPFNSGERAGHFGDYYCLVSLKGFKLPEGLYSGPSRSISSPYHPELLVKHGTWGSSPLMLYKQGIRYSRHHLPFRHISPWQDKPSVLELSVVCPCHCRKPVACALWWPCGMAAWHWTELSTWCSMHTGAMSQPTWARSTFVLSSF